MQAIIDSTKGGYTLGAGDWDHNSEKVRQARYAFNQDELKPYYESTRVLEDGVFYAATRLYGITFKRRADLQGYSPDMSVYEVFNEDGSALALFLCDLYARPNKRGGAWMNAYVPQNGLTGSKPVVGHPPERHEAGRRPAHAADARRGEHALPRVRPRAAWHVLRREVSEICRHPRAARLRGVPLAGQ